MGRLRRGRTSHRTGAALRDAGPSDDARLYTCVSSLVGMIHPYIYIYTWTIHTRSYQKRLFKPCFSEVPLTSSGQLFSSGASHGANPGNFPIPLREVQTEIGRFKRKL